MYKLAVETNSGTKILGPFAEMEDAEAYAAWLNLMEGIPFSAIGIFLYA
jgi:hypothetical protein